MYLCMYLYIYVFMCVCVYVCVCVHVSMCVFMYNMDHPSDTTVHTTASCGILAGTGNGSKDPSGGFDPGNPLHHVWVL